MDTQTRIEKSFIAALHPSANLAAIARREELQETLSTGERCPRCGQRNTLPTRTITGILHWHGCRSCGCTFPVLYLPDV